MWAHACWQIRCECAGLPNSEKPIHDNSSQKVRNLPLELHAYSLESLRDRQNNVLVLFQQQDSPPLPITKLSHPIPRFRTTPARDSRAGTIAPTGKTYRSSPSATGRRATSTAIGSHGPEGCGNTGSGSTSSRREVGPRLPVLS